MGFPRPHITRATLQLRGATSLASLLAIAGFGCGEDDPPSTAEPAQGHGDMAMAGSVGSDGAAGWSPDPQGAPGTAGGPEGSAGSAGAAGTAGDPGGSAGTAGAAAGTAGTAGDPGGMAGTSGADGGTGGSDMPPDNTGMQPSSGCGAASPPSSGTYTISVSGTQRSYIVKVPSGYDSNRPYRLVFAWHYMGGTAAGIASGGYYGMEPRANNSAIFVAPQGLGSPAGWANTGGRDVAFNRALVERLRGEYCVDENRIFGAGMSYGGIMSNLAGCQLGDLFRAVAPMAGSSAAMGRSCVGRVAIWIAHGRSDNFPAVSFSNGEASRDRWVALNNCSSQSDPVSPTSCVAYRGCDEGYPVHWCAFSGGHVPPPFAGEGIWNFFSQF